MKNAKNDIMSIWQLETSLYRNRNFVIFRGKKRDKERHIYKSSAYKKLSFCIRWYY